MICYTQPADNNTTAHFDSNRNRPISAYGTAI